MTSKVLVKLPVVPFSQKGSSCDDVLQRPKKQPPASNSASSNASDSQPTGAESSDAARPHEHSHEDKVAQLEQNLEFLQEQHRTMLVALHKEIDQLRQRNRELQFQLVFSSKGPKISPCGISSPEDAATCGSASNKLTESPTNVMPLQMELLEKDAQELKVCLDEERKLNASLSATIDKQQQALDALARAATRSASDKAVQVDTTMECQQVEMQARLVDAEALVKRLRQENVEQRKELGQLKQQVSSCSSSTSSSSSSRNGRSAAATHRVVPGPPSSYYPSSAAPIVAAVAIDPQQPQLSDEQQHQRAFPKFPPLQTQSYWHRASRTNHGGYDSGPQLHSYQRNARHHNHHHQSHHQSHHQPAQQQQQQQYQHHQQLNQESRHQHHHNRHQALVQQQQSKDGQAKSSSSSSSSAASNSLLPQLRNGGVRVDTSGGSYPPFFRPRHSYYKDNNCDQPQAQQQNRSGNSRKYRGPKPPRRENGHHPQDGGTPRDYTGNQQHHNRDNQRQPRKPRS
ncbi:hormone receptor 4-like [Trichogramma pretiosum]|uniref:hormone receptor 4-like n=1 Tax=Trichogramma pretiosum TaxID=7493 RepID=UPI0006C97C23|nr:hormone receptor 4-like [Trichogramma pretiosum]